LVRGYAAILPKNENLSTHFLHLHHRKTDVHCFKAHLTYRSPGLQSHKAPLFCFKADVPCHKTHLQWSKADLQSRKADVP
jgi:hypothetical protein